MKKGFLWFLVLALMATSLVLVGCGDDDDNNGGGTGSGLPFDETDYNFALLIIGGGVYARDTWSISIYATDYETSIESVTLTINGETVELNHYYDSWTGTFTGAASGDVVAISCTIDGTTYTEDITLCHTYTEANFPETWDMSESHELTWTMGGDNMFQYISAYAEWYDWDNDEYNEDDKMITLSNSARSYTAPANWFKVGDTTEYDMSILLMSMNWAGNNGFLVASNTGASAYYYMYRDVQPTPQEIARKSLDVLLEHIGE